MEDREEEEPWSPHCTKKEQESTTTAAITSKSLTIMTKIKLQFENDFSFFGNTDIRESKSISQNMSNDFSVVGAWGGGGPKDNGKVIHNIALPHYV